MSAPTPTCTFGQSAVGGFVLTLIPILIGAGILIAIVFTYMEFRGAFAGAGIDTGGTILLVVLTIVLLVAAAAILPSLLSAAQTAGC